MKFYKFTGALFVGVLILGIMNPPFEATAQPPVPHGVQCTTYPWSTSTPYAGTIENASDGVTPNYDNETGPGWGRIYLYTKSNETVLTEEEAAAYFEHYTTPWEDRTQSSVDKVGVAGLSEVANGACFDLQRIPEWYALYQTGVPLKVVCIIDKLDEATGAGYTTSTTVIINSSDPQLFPACKLYKIPTPVVKEQSATELLVSWTPLPDPYNTIAGYRIYRKVEGTQTFSCIGNTTTNSFLDTAYKPNTVYWYKIGVLYKGEQNGLENFNTYVASFYTSVPVASKAKYSESTGGEYAFILWISIVLGAAALLALVIFSEIKEKRRGRKD